MCGQIQSRWCQLRVSTGRAVAPQYPELLTCPLAQVLDEAPQALRVVPAPVFVAVGPADERGPSVLVPAPCQDRCGVPALVGEQHDRLRPCEREPSVPISSPCGTWLRTGRAVIGLTITSSYGRSSTFARLGGFPMTAWQYAQLAITRDDRGSEDTRTILWHGPGRGIDGARQ